MFDLGQQNQTILSAIQFWHQTKVEYLDLSKLMYLSRLGMMYLRSF